MRGAGKDSGSTLEFFFSFQLFLPGGTAYFTGVRDSTFDCVLMRIARLNNNHSYNVSKNSSSSFPLSNAQGGPGVVLIILQVSPPSVFTKHLRIECGCNFWN